MDIPGSPQVEEEYDSFQDKQENVVIDPLSESGSDDVAWHGLDLSDRGLYTVSSSISIYRHLTSLFLRNNNLSELQPAVCNLTALTNLDLSYNRLTALPPQIENLQRLKRLTLFNNRIAELPLEMGRLWRLTNLSVEGNPITSPPVATLQGGTTEIIGYLRDRVRPKPPLPDRGWVNYVDLPENAPSDGRFRVFTYNILAENYATQERHPYVPYWALEWDYRKQRILKQLISYKADIICLQEVESRQYREYFEPEMQALGYVSVFRAKSRARTMSNSNSVDGCATFLLKSKFTLVEDHLVEFQSLALTRFAHLTGDRGGMERLMVRDNIATILVLQYQGTISSSRARGRKKPKHLILANTHIHWDPTMSDVKVMQAQFLLEEVAHIRSKIKEHNPPLIICGDFNSVPSSGVYELMREGRLPPDHPAFNGYEFGKYSQDGLKHNLQLESAYNAIGEPPFSNFNGDFMGVLDYLWFSENALRVIGVLQPYSMEEIEQQRSPLPNPHLPSDHICLMAEFEFHATNHRDSGHRDGGHRDSKDRDHMSNRR